jgi:hypothetical protein
MELTPGLQRVVLVVLTVGLTVLGIFVIEARHHGTPSAAASSSAPASASDANSGAGAAPSAVTAPTAAPAGPAATSPAQIYQWLPFTSTDLSAAANTTTAFAKAYATWNDTETPQQYAASFKGLADQNAINLIEPGFASNAQRTADKESSTGSGAITSITQFSGSPSVSITFLVTITQQVTPAATTASAATPYTVTVVPSGAAWQVDDIELATAGVQGNR